MNFEPFLNLWVEIQNSFQTIQNSKLTMSKKKKVVVSTTSVPKKKVKVTPTTTSRSKAAKIQNEPLIFGDMNYKIMGLGAVLIAIGLLLMTGGAQPSPDVWDDNIIYNWRITVLSPIVILTGLGIEIYAIFKK